MCWHPADDAIRDPLMSCTFLEIGSSTTGVRLNDHLEQIPNSKYDRCPPVYDELYRTSRVAIEMWKFASDDVTHYEVAASKRKLALQNRCSM